jgi:biotin operon repressor
MGTEYKVLKYLKKRKIASGREICKFFGFSRQNLNKLVRKLIGQGAVVKEGKTKGALYRVVEKFKNFHQYKDIEYLKK